MRLQEILMVQRQALQIQDAIHFLPRYLRKTQSRMPAIWLER
jgi:hypothetical protein